MYIYIQKSTLSNDKKKKENSEILSPQRTMKNKKLSAAENV